MGTIASQLGVHHSTLERVLGEAGVERERQRPRRPSKLDSYMGFITETLQRFPIAAAPKRGRIPGRPLLDPETVSEAQTLIDAGLSPARAAKHLGIGRATPKARSPEPGGRRAEGGARRAKSAGDGRAQAARRLRRRSEFPDLDVPKDDSTQPPSVFWANWSLYDLWIPYAAANTG